MNKTTGIIPSTTASQVFDFNQKKVTTILIDGMPWFIAKDVCDILGLDNVTKAMYVLDEDEKLTLPIVRAGQKRTTNIINQSGIYNLCFRSNKPQAKALRKWVTSEVLPAIMKTGSYTTPGKDGVIDVRDLPITILHYNNNAVKSFIYNNQQWYCLSDLLRAFGKKTQAYTIVKSLNSKTTNAQRFLTYGRVQHVIYSNQAGANILKSFQNRIQSQQSPSSYQQLSFI